MNSRCDIGCLFSRLALSFDICTSPAYSVREALLFRILSERALCGTFFPKTKMFWSSVLLCIVGKSLCKEYILFKNIQISMYIVGTSPLWNILSKNIQRSMYFFGKSPFFPTKCPLWNILSKNMQPNMYIVEKSPLWTIQRALRETFFPTVYN